MSKLLIFVSATIVLFLGIGPSFASPLNEVPQSPPSEPQPAAAPIDENLSKSEVGPMTEPPPPNARYYNYQQALTFRFGRASEAKNLKLNAGSDDILIGFQFMFPKFLSPKLEAGVDLQNEGIGHMHVGARWIWRERSYFRPSVKLGADGKIDSKEKLATFTKLENYSARASATLEYVVWNPYSVRLEHELIVNHLTQSMAGSLGISRGW